MQTSISRRRNFTGPRKQSGMIAMLIAVIVLVCTLLAVIGLMRSVDTSNLIAGSLSFRQGVVQEAERAYSVARTGIPTGASSQSDLPAAGYFASMQARPAPPNAHQDLPAGIVGDPGTTPTQALLLPAGPADTTNLVYYMVERLCRAGVTTPTRADCVLPAAYTKGGTNDESNSVILPGAAQAAYRLTVRVDGPRKAQAYVQTIIR